MLLKNENIEGKITRDNILDSEGFVTRSKSSTKGEKFNETCSEEKNSEKSQSWLFVNVDQLRKIVEDLICPQCSTDNLKVSTSENMGFSVRIIIKCSSCPFEKSEMSSPRQYNSNQENDGFEINTLIVMLTQELGVGHAALDTISRVLGMKNLHSKSYQRISKKVSYITIRAGAEVLDRAVERVKQSIMTADPELNPESIFDLSVSFDGTWHKRGFTSHYGIGVVIDRSYNWTNPIYLMVTVIYL
jgi:hypothetical protein